MNAIRATQALNKRELEAAVPPSASWHVDYRDTAYIYVGGLPLDLSEGDVVAIFSQYGNPTHLNMIRDKETGKSKGFAFLKYEDQRSCDLAVDNLGGAEVLGRMLRVDHTRYKQKEGEDEDTHKIERLEAEASGENGKRASDTEDDTGDERRRRKKRKLLKEEEELEAMLAVKEDADDEDPMRGYLLEQKKEDVAKARRREDEREKKHRHRHKHRHSSRNEEEDDGDRRGSKSHRHRHRNGRDEHDDHLSRERREGIDNKAANERRHHKSNHDRDDRRSHRWRDEPSLSPDDRKQRRRASSKDRYGKRDDSRERKHRRKDYDNDRDRR